MNTRSLFLLICALWAAALLPVVAGEITVAGNLLAVRLDSMHVDKLWLPGKQVDWRTGEPNGKTYPTVKGHTHCSAFAAAAAEQLGVYLLRPPEHSAVLLANAQEEWLTGEGAHQGWSQVDSPIKAQQLANQGQLVVVTFKSHDSKTPGHIAVVRPSTKDDARIKEEGPEIIQAGRNNFTDTTVKEGFKFHTNAFENNELLYFSHPIPQLTELTH